MKKPIIAVVLVYLAWFLLEGVVHGKLLMGLYDATSHLWRPEEEMNMGYMIAMNLSLAVLLVAFYKLMIPSKSPAAGIKYGILLGLVVGVAGGLGPYCWMPIPFTLAIGWFLAAFTKFTLGGAIVGALVKD